MAWRGLFGPGGFPDERDARRLPDVSDGLKEHALKQVDSGGLLDVFPLVFGGEVVFPEAGEEVADFIEDEECLSPQDASIKESLKKSLGDVLSTLSPREESVVRMRFGLDNELDLTLEEVGKNFSVTRERIRQIEAKAIKKLKHPSRKKYLSSFDEDR